MADPARVSYARQGELWILRFEGPIRYLLAPSLNRFIDRLFAGPAPGAVCLDLRAATAIDSTGIGLLAKVANGMQGAGRARPVVVSTNPEISELLVNLCLDEVCILAASAADAPEPVVGEPIPYTTPSEQELARTVLDAHRRLSAISEENREAFRSVIEAFAQEVHQANGADGVEGTKGAKGAKGGSSPAT